MLLTLAWCCCCRPPRTPPTARARWRRSARSRTRSATAATPPTWASCGSTSTTDCVVSITFALDGNRLLDGDSLSVTVDDRVFNARGRREGEHLIVFETTVEALGLRPGRASKIAFASRYGNDADTTDTFELKVDYGAVMGVQITGRAKPGHTLTCVTDEPVQLAARRPRDQAARRSARTSCAAPTPATGSPAAPRPRPRPRSAFSAGRTGGSSPSASAADGRRRPPARPPSSSGRRSPRRRRRRTPRRSSTCRRRCWSTSTASGRRRRAGRRTTRATTIAA